MAKILCIDDEPDLLKNVVAELEAAGFDVLSTTDSTEGLNLIIRHHPDLTLCDIQMPEMNGLQILKEVRANYPSLAEMPFVFLTAFSSREKMIAGLEHGADDYLTKPVDYDVLVAKINALLRQANRVEKKKEREHLKLYKALTESDASQQPDAADKPNAGNKNITIAVVGKDKRVEDMNKILESSNYNVSTTKSGNEFLENFSEIQPDLVFAWYETSDINGVLTTKFAQTLPKESDVPFILVWHMQPTPVPPAISSLDEITEIIEWPCNPGAIGETINKWIPA